MSKLVSDFLGRIGLNRSEKIARTRDLDAAQRLFLHCAQGALREAGVGKRSEARDPRASLYEKIEARLADAGVTAVAELPEIEVAELALQERAIMAGDEEFEALLVSLADEDRDYARHVRSTWEEEAERFRAEQTR